jgi:hypothetical protein
MLHYSSGWTPKSLNIQLKLFVLNFISFLHCTEAKTFYTKDVIILLYYIVHDVDSPSWIPTAICPEEMPNPWMAS